MLSTSFVLVNAVADIPVAVSVAPAAAAVHKTITLGTQQAADGRVNLDCVFTWLAILFPLKPNILNIPYPQFLVNIYT